MKALRILETSLYANDLQRAEEFYTKVLGLPLFAREPGRHLFFKCRDQMLLIFDPSKTVRETEVAPHGASGPGHVAFAVPDSELELWTAKLLESGVGIEKVVSWPRGGRSIYFRDPAGNSLEFASPKIWAMEENE
jgi:catechol 2,3-dioxygenase-like lactoylglutathione lyase family enzyme